jgi:hypothetical protein
VGVDEEGNPIAVQDGDEVVTQVSARGSWKINRSNWLELGWQYLSLDSDLRADFDRTRVETGLEDADLSSRSVAGRAGARTSVDR